MKKQKQPSIATQLRRAKQAIKSLEFVQAKLVQELHDTQEQSYQQRLEIAQWKRRFDLLLARVPVIEGKPADTVEGPIDPRLQQCIDLLKQNPGRNYVASIKLYRQLFNASLVDAKNAMEVERGKLRVQTDRMQEPTSGDPVLAGMNEAYRAISGK